MRQILAIPTHRRAALLRSKTLKFLADQKALDGLQVVLFLSDEKDEEDYRSLVDGFGIEACVATGSLTDKFNAIHTRWPNGVQVAVMEDDIEVVHAHKPAGSKTVKVLPCTNILAEIARGFEALPSEGGIWGVAPHANGFYFTGKLTTTLKLVVAHFYGFVSSPFHDDLLVRSPSKTDYERTCRYFVRYARTTRLDWLGVKTASYTQAGGMQADHSREERLALEEKSVAYITETWPHLIERNTKKESIFPEMSFKRGGYPKTQGELRALQRALDRRVPRGT